MADDGSISKVGSSPGGASAAARAYAQERIEWRALNIAATVFFAGAVVFGVVYGFKGDTFYLRLATEALIFGAVALSVDILLGFAGLLSLGQALYFGLGAYTGALVLKQVAESFWLVMGTSILVGIVAGLIGGLIAIRARGVYFALITYGLAQIVAKVIYNTRELGASDGITGIPIISVSLGFWQTKADNPAGFFFVVLAVIGVIYLGLLYLSGTPFGRALSGVRINESRMPFLGYQPDRLKLAAFVLAATIASIAGGIYPMLRGFVSPELMYFEASTNAIVATMIGGTGTLIGPLYGSVILVFLKSIIGTITTHQIMVIGVLFMVVVIFFPRGLLGYLRDKLVAKSRAKDGGAS
jgi:branched-chain amino acid transport system permease protein